MSTSPGLHPEAQMRIQSLVEKLVSSGNDRGVQVAVYREGKLIVDVFAGTMDATSGRKVDAQTLFPVFSTTKGVAATIVHRLVERGLLDYEAPIAKYWPEFAAEGKGSITLRHAMSHTSGMWAMPKGLEMGDLADWDGMCQRIADLPAATAPGTQVRYHAITYSWLVCEPACRVTGKTFPELVREEITSPLGIEQDLFMGISDREQARVATLETPHPFTMPATEDLAIPNYVLPLETLMNDPRLQRACVPASAGIMTAHAIARHYASLLPGGVDGVQLMSDTTHAYATRLHRPDNDTPVAELPHRFGLGYGLRGPLDDLTSLFGHGGYGGSTGYADQRRGLGVGVTKNTMNAPRQVADLVAEVLNTLF